MHQMSKSIHSNSYLSKLLQADVPTSGSHNGSGVVRSIYYNFPSVSTALRTSALKQSHAACMEKN